MAHIFVDLFKTFDSTHKGKLKKMILAYGLPKKMSQP